MKIKHNLYQLLIALDQLANVVIFMLFAPCKKHWADETLSSHAYRLDAAGIRSWPRRWIDRMALLFRDKDHCHQAFLSERYGLQLPPEARPDS